MSRFPDELLNTLCYFQIIFRGKHILGAQCFINTRTSYRIFTAAVDEECDKVEAALVYLENICEEQDLLRNKQSHQKQLAAYKLKKAQELERIKSKLFFLQNCSKATMPFQNTFVSSPFWLILVVIELLIAAMTLKIKHFIMISFVDVSLALFSFKTAHPQFLYWPVKCTSSKVKVASCHSKINFTVYLFFKYYWKCKGLH